MTERRMWILGWALFGCWLRLLVDPDPTQGSWTVSSTAYCLNGTMADGSQTRAGSVANNFLPLGTRITVTPGFLGQTRFVVRDRIGWGTQLDFWTGSCGTAIQYGRHTQTIRRGWPRRKTYRNFYSIKP